MLKRTHHHGEFISLIIDLTADGQNNSMVGRVDDDVGVTIHFRNIIINNI
jgi:hypothetical protein